MELIFLIFFFILFLVALFGGNKKRKQRSSRSAGTSVPVTYGDHKQGSDHPNTGSYTSWSDSNDGDGSGNDGNSSGD